MAINVASAGGSPGGCPVEHQGREGDDCPVRSRSCAINPDNQMPFARDLEECPTGGGLLHGLGSERETSAIPRADSGGRWQYPSASMFYNALVRKGKGVPPSEVDSMLAIHNGLNDAVWAEIVEKEAAIHPECPAVKLVRFQGRPSDLSPTAWWHVRVRGGQPPFDRHDWVIDRCGCQVRYVIDYYASGDAEDTFSVHIRPAVDSTQGLLDRFRLFYRASLGGAGSLK